MCGIIPHCVINLHFLTTGEFGGLVVKLCPTLVTPRTVACQAPLSMGFSRQRYQSGMPLPRKEQFHYKQDLVFAHQQRFQLTKELWFGTGHQTALFSSQNFHFLQFPCLESIPVSLSNQKRLHSFNLIQHISVEYPALSLLTVMDVVFDFTDTCLNL